MGSVDNKPTIIVTRKFVVTVRMRVHSRHEVNEASDHLQRRIRQAIPEKRLRTMSGYVTEVISSRTDMK